MQRRHKKAFIIESRLSFVVIKNTEDASEPDLSVCQSPISKNQNFPQLSLKNLNNLELQFKNKQKKFPESQQNRVSLFILQCEGMNKRKLPIIQFILLLLALAWQAQLYNYICISLILFLLLTLALSVVLQKYLNKYASIPINIGQIWCSVHRLVKIDNLLTLVFKLSNIRAPNSDQLEIRNFDTEFQKRKVDDGPDQNKYREMQRKFNFSARVLENVGEVLGHIEDKYRQIHKLLPILIFYFPEYTRLRQNEEKQLRRIHDNGQKRQNKKIQSFKQRLERMVDMARKIQKEVRLNEKIYGKKVFLIKVIWKLKNVYGLWVQIQELLKKSQQNEECKELLSEKNKILINSIQLAFSKQNIEVEEQNQRTKNALSVIDEYLSSDSEVSSQPQLSLNLNSQYFHLNDSNNGSSDHPRENKPQEISSYDRQKFKSELNMLLLKGFEQRKAKQEQNQSEQSLTVLETKIKYDQNTKQYQVIDLDMDDNFDHEY